MKTNRGIYEKSPGSGEWWIRYADASGRIRREKAGTKSQANALYHKRKADVLTGHKLPESLRRRVVPFCEIADDALAYADRNKRSASTDHWRMKKLKEWFADRPADSIPPEDFESHFHAEKWRAGATWNRYRALVSLAYRLAIRAGKVTVNPARQITHKAENNGRVRFLSPEDESKLRRVINEKFPQHEPELNLALHTGLRKSEQYSARWNEVDFERRVLTVPLDKGDKTSHVRLNAAALHALAELHTRTAETGYVCAGLRSPRGWFEVALEAAGIQDFTWHDLRHTFASRLVMSGADLRTVAELLRDKTLAMVMRYAHLAPDFQLEAVERMGALFWKQTDTRTDTNRQSGSEKAAGLVQ